MAFCRRYGAFEKVIGWDPDRVGDVVSAANDEQFDAVADLHCASFDSDAHVRWLSDLRTAELRVSRRRAPCLRSPLSTVRVHEDRIYRTRLHNVEHYLQVLGVRGLPMSDDMLRIAPTPDDLRYAWIRRLTTGSVRRIGLVPNSRYRHKEWAAASWLELAEFLQSKLGLRVCVLCSVGEIERSRLHGGSSGLDFLVASCPEAHVANVLSTDLVVSVDSGLKHVAAYLGLPVVALYGHASPAVWGTLSSLEVPVLSSAPCRPCNNPFRCERGKDGCVSTISAGYVAAAVSGVLERMERAQSTGEVLLRGPRTRFRL